MHGREGSDCAVLPVNQPNNGVPPSAEVGEERVQTKENIAHSRTRPTQSGRGVSQGLRGVRQAAQDRKQERFTALLHHLTIELLRASFFALQRKAAPGIEATQIGKLLDLGVDGIISDRPDIVRQVMGKRGLAFPPATPVTP